MSESMQCTVDCYGECQREVYSENKCILHCHKNDYSKDWNSGLLSDFYDALIEYTIEQIFKYKELLDDKYSKEDIDTYFKTRKLDDEECNKALKKSIFIPNCIHFPARDSRDYFDYLKILNLFGQIHFNYCEFYVSYLELTDVECFFQDCKFHERWTLYDYEVLQNEDNVIYQTCEFFGNVSNYTPEDTKSLATFKHSQFDYTCKFHEKLEFDRCNFADRLFNTNQNNFLDTNKIKKLSIENTIFEEKFKLNDYVILDFKCKNTLFKNKFEFKENIIDNLIIDNSNFDMVSDFFGCKFKIFKIHKSIFDDFVGFETCEFGTDKRLKEEIAIFKYATFTNFITFRNTQFKSGLDIENINLKEAPNFLNSKIELDNTNRETFRIVKHSFDSIGNIIEANKFYQKEMQKREEELSGEQPRVFSEWLVFKIHDISSKHSQDWVLVLYWIIVITFLYSHFKVFACQEKTEYYIIPFGVNVVISIYVLFENMISKNINNSTKIFSALTMYFIYAFITNDVFLYCFSNNINPFSIMTGHDTLNFSTLIYKIVIAYLMYQLIVSIRQNTRRK